MDHDLSSLATDIKAGLPSSSSSYSPHQEGTHSPVAFILQQVVNGEHKKQMPSITHSAMVTSTPNDTTLPSHNTQGAGESNSSANQPQPGSSHGSRGQSNPCDVVAGLGGGSSSGAGGSGGDENRRQDRPADQDEEDDTSHEQSGETTTSSTSGSSIPQLIPPAPEPDFPANPHPVRRHNDSNHFQDHPISQDQSANSDNGSVGGVSDATTAVISDSDVRWQGVTPSSCLNHQSNPTAVVKSSSSSLNSPDPPTAPVSEGLDVSSIVTLSTLSSLTNTSSSSTDGKNILLSSLSMQKGNMTHDSSDEGNSLETKRSAHVSNPSSPPMSKSFRDSDLELSGVSDEALSSTPVESSAPLQLSEPLLILETLEDDEDRDIIPPSPEARTVVVPGTPPEDIHSQVHLSKQRNEDSSAHEDSKILEAKEKSHGKVAAKAQSDPSEMASVTAPTKLSDEQLSRGVEISPVKISPLQDPVYKRMTTPSAAVSRRIQFDSSTDESHDSPSLMPPSSPKSDKNQHSSPVPLTQFPIEIIQNLLDCPSESVTEDKCATKTHGAENCDKNRSSSHQLSRQNKSSNETVVEVSTAFAATVSCSVHGDCAFSAPALPICSQQLYLEEDSSTDEYDEEDDPKNTFTQAESQGGIYEPLVLSELDESIPPDAVLVSAYDIPSRPLANVTRDKKEIHTNLVPVPSKNISSTESQQTMQNMQLHPPIVADSTEQTTTKALPNIPLAQQLIPEEDPFAMLRQPDLSFGEMMLGLPGPSGVKLDAAPQPHHSDTDSDASDANVPQEPPKLSIRELLKSHELHSMIPVGGSVKGKGKGKRSKKNEVEKVVSLEESLRQEFTALPQLLPPAYDPLQRPSPKPPDRNLNLELATDQVFVSTDSEVNISIATELSLQEQHSLQTPLQRLTHSSVSPSDSKVPPKAIECDHPVDSVEATITTNTVSGTTDRTTTSTDTASIKRKRRSAGRENLLSTLKRKTRTGFIHQVNLRTRSVKRGLRKLEASEHAPTLSHPMDVSECFAEIKKDVGRIKCRNAKKQNAPPFIQRKRKTSKPLPVVVSAAAVTTKPAPSRSLKKGTQSTLFSSEGRTKVACTADHDSPAVPVIFKTLDEALKVPKMKCSLKDASNEPDDEETDKALHISSKRLRMEAAKSSTKETLSSQASSAPSTQPVAQRVITTTVITKRFIVEEFLCQGKVIEKHCHQIEEDPVVTQLIETVPPDCSPCTITSSHHKGATHTIPIFRTPSNTSTSSSSLMKTSSSGSLADVSSIGSSSSGTPYPSQRTKSKSTLHHEESPEQYTCPSSIGTRHSDGRSAIEIYVARTGDETRLTFSSSSDCGVSGNNAEALSRHLDMPLPSTTNLLDANSSSKLQSWQKQYSLRHKVPTTSTVDRRKCLEQRPSSSVEEDPSLTATLQLPSVSKYGVDTAQSKPVEKKRSKSPPDSSCKGEQQKHLNKTSSEEKSSVPSAAKSSQSDIPADGDSTGVVRIICEGLRVIAQWRDGRYYPGEVTNRDKKDRWVVKFDDGNSKSIAEAKIVGVNKLPVGTSLYAKIDADDFDSGIVQGHFYKDSSLNYVIDMDTGKKLVVPCSFIMMTSDQVSCLRGDDVNPTNSEEGCSVTLKNVIEGSRRSRSVALSTSSLESPSKTVSSVSKVAQSPKELTPKTPKLQHSQRRACPASHDLKVTSEEVSSPKRRRKETPLGALSPRKSRAKSTPNRTPKRTPHSTVVDMQNEVAEQPAVHDPALGRIPPEGSTLFEGQIFVLTSADKPSKLEKALPEEGSSLSSTDTTLTEEEIPVPIPFSKSHLKLQIHTGGGIVLDEFDDTVLNSSGDCFLISNCHVRTSKFLRCLAVGIPCVSHVWIVNSCCLGILQDYKAYLLPTGVSLITKRLIEWHGNTRVLAGLDICVCGNTEFVDVWTSIAKSAGATVTLRLPVLSGGKNAPALNIHAVVTDSNCPSAIIRRCGKLGIPIVSVEWVVQSLIQGKRLDLNDHPKFRFDSLYDS